MHAGDSKRRIKALIMVELWNMTSCLIHVSLYGRFLGIVHIGAYYINTGKGGSGVWPVLIFSKKVCIRRKGLISLTEGEKGL